MNRTEKLMLLWSLVSGLSLGSMAAPRGGPGLARMTPESQGVSSAALLGFIEAADRELDSLHSVMLLRHGHVVAEGWWAPYHAESRHELYSLSKSFTATAVGLAVAEGRLSLDDEVLKFFPEAAPQMPSEHLKAMRVRDLLSMMAGHTNEISSAPDTVSPAAFLAHPVPFKPGTIFRYNTPATFMLSAIVQRQTGASVLNYLRPRLFDPLGIEDPQWSTNFQGITLGGYGLRVRTEDIARFGQLYLDRGRWQGKRLLSPEWVAEATSKQAGNGSNPKSDWEQGYGFQFWRCRHGAYRGDGAFGQYCIVMPEQDAVMAITSGLRDMQAVLNLVWDRVLPAMKAAPMDEDPKAQQQLKERLAGLVLRQPKGAAASPMASKVAGRRYVFPANDQKLEALTLVPGGADGGADLLARINGRETRIPAGYGQWRRGRGPFGTSRDEALAGSGAWVADDTYVLRLCAYETPFVSEMKLRFVGEEVFVDGEQNVGFGGGRTSRLVGKAE